MNTLTPSQTLLGSSLNKMMSSHLHQPVCCRWMVLCKQMQTKLNVWTQNHCMIYLVFNTPKLSMVPPVGMVVWKYSIWENLASHVHLSSWYHYSYTGKVNTKIMPGVSVLYLSRKYYKHFLIFFLPVSSSSAGVTRAPGKRILWLLCIWTLYLCKNHFGMEWRGWQLIAV